MTPEEAAADYVISFIDRAPPQEGWIYISIETAFLAGVIWARKNSDHKISNDPLPKEEEVKLINLGNGDHKNSWRKLFSRGRDLKKGESGYFSLKGPIPADFDMDAGCGIGRFKFGHSWECAQHDLGALTASTPEEHRENDRNFWKNLRFKWKKNPDLFHFLEWMSMGGIVRLLSKVFPFWHKDKSRVEEWIERSKK